MLFPMLNLLYFIIIIIIIIATLNREPPFNSETKNEWNYTSTLSLVSMAYKSRNVPFTHRIWRAFEQGAVSQIELRSLKFLLQSATR